MRVAGAVALVSGANRGLGRAIVEILLSAGCRKVYAGMRSLAAAPFRNGGVRVQQVELDITDLRKVAAVAHTCPDVDLLVNNAGIVTHTSCLDARSVEQMRQEMEVNYFGPLNLCRAFAPILAKNGGGAIVNILSLGALVSIPRVGTYCAAKAAALSMTRSVRAEVAAVGTQVLAVYPGAIETGMTASNSLRAAPQDVARAVIEGVEQDLEELFPDAGSRDFAAALAADAAAVHRRFAHMLPGTAAETQRLMEAAAQTNEQSGAQ